MESQNIEYKQSWHDEYLKWVCGFANAQGGRIYIGLDDNGRLVGLTDAKRLSEDIPNKIREHIGIICDVNLLVQNDLPYIEILVQPSSVPVSLRGRYYYRSGSVKNELTGTALNEFLLSKTGMTWDDVIEPRATMDDIDPMAIQRFKVEASKGDRLGVIDGLTDWEMLTKLCLTDGKQLKRAALILFGKDPGRFYPNIQFKIGRFADPVTLLHQDVVEGNLMKMLQDILEILEYKYIIRKVKIEGYRRVQQRGNYPRVALREMILNSLVHRSYLGPMTQMRVYDDHIVLWNYGTLPTELTVQQLFAPHPSFPRNPLIANACFRANMIEAWGSGIHRIIESCQAEGFPAPTIEEAMGGMQITLWTNPTNTPQNTPQIDTDTPQNTPQKDTDAPQNTPQIGTDTPQKSREDDTLTERILTLLQANNRISQRAMAEQLGIGFDTVKEYMTKLKRNGTIRRIGADRGGHWQIINPNKE